MGKFMQDAGILDSKENLSKEIKQKIIERLKKTAIEGATESGLDSSLDTNRVLLPKDIEDEKKYPEFHKLIFTAYEKIAKGLNIESSPSMPFPFCDPSALASILNLPDPALNIAFVPLLTPPALAAIFGLPPDAIPLLQSGFNTAALPVPKFDAPKIDENINLSPPSNFSQKFEFDNWPLKLSAIFAKIASEIKAKPDVPALLQLVNGQTANIKNDIKNSEAFGPGEDGDESLLRIRNDLCEFGATCTAIAVVGSNLGSSPGGAVGFMGFQAGAKPPLALKSKPRPNFPPAFLELPPPEYKYENPDSQKDSILLIDADWQNENLSPKRRSQIGLENTTPQFRRRLFNVARRLHPNKPEFVDWLALIIAVETGGEFSAQTRHPNPKFSASGLIQFTKNTAKDLGTNINAIRQMHELEQFYWVEKYLLRAFGGENKASGGSRRPPKDISIAYAHILYPAMANNPGLILKENSSDPKNAAAYTANKSYDVNNNKEITLSELSSIFVGLYNRLKSRGKRILVDENKIIEANPKTWKYSPHNGILTTEPLGHFGPSPYKQLYTISKPPAESTLLIPKKETTPTTEPTTNTQANKNDQDSSETDDPEDDLTDDNVSFMPGPESDDIDDEIDDND